MTVCQLKTFFFSSPSQKMIERSLDWCIIAQIHKRTSTRKLSQEDKFYVTFGDPRRVLSFVIV